jgi:Cu-Zn family superoxide dismutase
MSIKKLATATVAAALFGGTAIVLSTSPASAQHEKEKDMAGHTKAVAVLIPTKGSNTSGRVTFTKQGNKVRVHAEISGLTPGKHGFHVHEYGVYSEDGMAAGGHFNPHHAQHAAPEAAKRHVGDLGNITANANGNATLDIEDSHLAFHGPNSIIGRGVVVHAKADDFGQPVGNAGGRVAVGTIAIAKP